MTRPGAARILDNGSSVTDARHLTDYPAALQVCFDVDTTAITGGIVAAHTGAGDRQGTHGVPTEWITNREPLPHS